MGKLPRFETPIQKEKRLEKQMTFSDRYEEELKRQLFEEEENSKAAKETVESILYSDTQVHKKRENEK